MGKRTKVVKKENGFRIVSGSDGMYKIQELYWFWWRDVVFPSSPTVEPRLWHNSVSADKYFKKCLSRQG